MAESEDVRPAIGIDLGTTNSRAGIWLAEENRFKLIENDQKNQSSPSYVAFTDTERLIGDAAKEQVCRNPANTVFDAKRLIGRKFSDLGADSDKVYLQWPFRVAKGKDDKLVIQVEYKGKAKAFSAEEVFSMILGQMKDLAEVSSGSVVNDACVSVPHCFNSAQRQATRNACTMAGLETVTLVSEPSCAALAYTLQNQSPSGEQKVMIFDLGGGSLDVTLFSIEEGVIEVKATSGDSQLGGEDFDLRLLQHFIQEIQQKHEQDISSHPRVLRRLKLHVERVKMALSSEVEAPIQIDSLLEDFDFHSSISRACFEEMNMDLFQKCIKCVEECLQRAQIEKTDVFEVVLIGGSSRIPKVQQLLAEFFNDEAKLNKSMNAEEAVVCGATARSGMSRGYKAFADYLIVDVAPMSFGLEIAGGAMHVMHPRNSSIPRSYEQLFTTCHDDQPGIFIQIFEGENPQTRNNTLIATMELSEIAPAPAGVPQILVRFDIDADGILTVLAKDKTSGHKVEIYMEDIDLCSGKVDHHDERRQMLSIQVCDSVENPTSSSGQHESSNSDESHVVETSLPALQVPSKSSPRSQPPPENDSSNTSSELVEPLESPDAVEERPPAYESGSQEALESPQAHEQIPEFTESPPEDVGLSNVVETGSQEFFEDSREYSSIESKAGEFSAPSPPQEQRSCETRPHQLPEPAVLSNDTHEVRAEEFAEPSQREPPRAHDADMVVEDEPQKAYDSSNSLSDVPRASRELEDRPHEPSELLQVHGTSEQYEPSPVSDHQEVEDIEELLEKIALEKRLLERAYEQDKVFPGSDLQEIRSPQVHGASNQNEPSSASDVQESRSPQVHGASNQNEPSPESDVQEIRSPQMHGASKQHEQIPGSILLEKIGSQSTMKHVPSPASNVQEIRSPRVHGTSNQNKPSPESDVQEIRTPQMHGASKQHEQIPGSINVLEIMRSQSTMKHVPSPASNVQEIRSPQVHGASKQYEPSPESDVQEIISSQMHEASKHYEPSLASDLQEIRSPQVHGTDKQYEPSPAGDLQEIRTSQVHGGSPASDGISVSFLEPDAAAGPDHESGNNIESSSPMTLVHEIIETIHLIASREDFQARKKECSTFIRRVNMLLPLFVEFRDSALPVSEEIFACFSSFDAALDTAKSLILLCNEGSKLYLILEHQKVAEQFMSVNTALLQALDKLPESLEISEEVREQVDLVHSQLKRSKVVEDALDANLYAELTSVEESMITGFDPDQLTRLAASFKLDTAASVRKELLALNGMTEKHGESAFGMLFRIVNYLEKLYPVEEEVRRSGSPQVSSNSLEGSQTTRAYGSQEFSARPPPARMERNPPLHKSSDSFDERSLSEAPQVYRKSTTFGARPHDASEPFPPRSDSKSQEFSERVSSSRRTDSSEFSPVNGTKSLEPLQPNISREASPSQRPSTRRVDSYEYQAGNGMNSFESLQANISGEASPSSRGVDSSQYNSGNSARSPEPLQAANISGEASPSQRPSTRRIDSYEYQAGNGMNSSESLQANNSEGASPSQRSSSRRVDSFQYNSGNSARSPEPLQAANISGEASRSSRRVDSYEYQAGNGVKSSESLQANMISREASPSQRSSSRRVDSYEYQAGNGMKSSDSLQANISVDSSEFSPGSSRVKGREPFQATNISGELQASPSQRSSSSRHEASELSPAYKSSNVSSEHTYKSSSTSEMSSEEFSGSGPVRDGVPELLRSATTAHATEPAVGHTPRADSVRSASCPQMRMSESIIEDVVKKYTWDDVLDMTNDLNSRPLGKGGFGAVFLGKLENGKEVAVKILDASSQQGINEFLNEVNLLKRINHVNLIRLLGYCQDERQVLIYEFAEEGSIWDHLQAGGTSLNWKQRLNIALQSACGLEYLHTGCSPRIIHRDIKSQNILLTKSMVAKVADFGLSKLGADQENLNKTHVTTMVKGTLGYLDPEYLKTGQLTEKSDVYSFGVILLEIITGRKPIQDSDKKRFIGDWVEDHYNGRALKGVADPNLGGHYNPKALKRVIEVAKLCTLPYGANRPDMTQVVRALRKAQAAENDEKKASIWSLPFRS